MSAGAPFRTLKRPKSFPFWDEIRKLLKIGGSKTGPTKPIAIAD
jgi:hypothetical protein